MKSIKLKLLIGLLRLCPLHSLHSTRSVSFLNKSPTLSNFQTLHASKHRSVQTVDKAVRLPIWPVQNGIIFTVLDFIGLKGLATWLEDKCGGRVCPMITSELQQDASDPFLLLAHHRHSFYPLDPFRPISNLLLPEGFPSHPHRGFQTVTYVMEGGMVHRDNMGLKQVYRSGSVQWLNAGSGIMHEEMWELNPWSPSGIEIYQIWVNLPQHLKMSTASIQLFGEGTDDPLPIKTFPDGSKVIVIGGEYMGLKSPCTLQQTPLTILHVVLKPNGIFELDALQHHNCFVYVRRGSMHVIATDNVPTREIRTHEMVWFNQDGSAISIKNMNKTELDFLVLEGEPLIEPRVGSGPFMMNSESELYEARTDYMNGFFGTPWDYKLTDDQWMEVVRNRNIPSEL